MKIGTATSDTIVGLFVVIGFLSIVLMTFVIRDDLFGGTYEFKASFQSVSGLEYGSPVLVSGIRNGRVNKINYIPQEEQQILQIFGANGEVIDEITQPVIVTMRVSDDIQIYSNATVRLVQQGFIGDKRVEIDPGSPDGGILITEKSDPLRSEPFFDMENVFRKADAIVTDLQATVSSFREFATDDANVIAIRETIQNLNQSVNKLYDYLESNEENVTASIENFKAISENMVEVTDRVKLFMDEGGRFDTISGDIEKTVAELNSDLDELVRITDETINTVNNTVANVDQRSERLTNSAIDLMDGTRGDIEKLTANLERTSANLDIITARLRSGEGTVGRLLTDPQPFEDMKETIEALHNFVIGQESQFYDYDIRYRKLPDGASQPEASTSP